MVTILASGAKIRNHATHVAGNTDIKIGNELSCDKQFNRDHVHLTYARGVRKGLPGGGDVWNPEGQEELVGGKGETEHPGQGGGGGVLGTLAGG